MKDLIELVQILSKQKTYSIQIIGENFNGDSILEQFYYGILNGDFNNDDEAAEALYQETPGSKKYKKLRTKLKKRLINTIFFIDKKSPDFNEYQKAYYNCCKEWAAMKILLGREARVAAVQLAHKIMRQTKKFEFTELYLDTARVLRMHYSVFEGDQSKFEQYDAIVKEQTVILRHETEAEEAYEQLVLRYVTNKSTQAEIQEKAREYANQLRPVAEQFSTHKLRLSLYLIEVLQHMSANDYPSTLEVCDRAIGFFESKDYESKITLITFLYQKLACHIQLRQFPKGKQTAERCLELMNPGPINWYKAMELYFMLNTHSGDYQIAFDTVQTALRHKRFEFLPDTLKETWRIYEGYSRWLYELELVEVKQKSRQPGKFRLGKFNNEVPIFSKDKSGMNIPIIIVNLLFQILHEKNDDLIDREEALRKYLTRHLKEEDTQRSELFIKLLLLFPAYSFDMAQIREKAQPYLDELAELPLEKANQSFEIEIIPYEAAWELLMRWFER